jgi:hypothetical protein
MIVGDRSAADRNELRSFPYGKYHCGDGQGSEKADTGQ